MANFDYKLALEMDRDIVFAHIATASPSSVSQALSRYKAEGNTAVVALIEEGRKANRIAKITAAVKAKQAA